MKRLNILAKDAKINENAGIRDQHSIIINAPVQKVWEILIDIENWEKWNESITEVKLMDEVNEGISFEWTYDQKKFNSEIQLFSPPKALAWTTKTTLSKGIYVWQLESDDNQTIVTLGSSQQGALVILTNNHHSIYKQLLGWLKNLKKEAEK